METEFEYYNKNIDELDARNIFELDMLKELNRKKFFMAEIEKKIRQKEIKMREDNYRQNFNFN